MNRLRLVCYFLPGLLILPLRCSAQSPDSQNPSLSAGAYSVSARDLSIPEKARKAFFKGNQRLAARDWAGGLVEFQRAIAAFPGYYEAWDKMGNADLDLSRNADAEAAFRKSIDLSAGKYAPPHSGLGLALCMEKRFTEAEASARDGIEIDPSYAAGHFALAWVLYVTGQLTESLESARRAVLEKPDFGEAWLLVAQIDMARHDSSALVQDLDEYLKVDPSGPARDKAIALRDQAQRTLVQQSAIVAANAAPSMAQ